MSNKGMPKKGSLINLSELIYPGIGIKRWVLLGGVGFLIFSLGLLYFLDRLLNFVATGLFSNNIIPLLLTGAGIIVLGKSLHGFYKSIGPLVLESDKLGDLTTIIYRRRRLSKGPKIVAMGGGTGLSVLLRGLKDYTYNLTAIVTVGDDGGSSGRLRKELGVVPPGDFRNCLVAMSDTESLVTDLFQYRFDQGNGLKGHNFGNLFLAAMSNVTNSFEQAVFESSRMLSVHGRILPATTANLTLTATLMDGVKVTGESNIRTSGGNIDYISIDPVGASAYAPALEAIKNAEIIVIGPGSLYTSVLPNLLINQIAEAVGESKAVKIYACNVATEIGETDGYSISDHVTALQSHTFDEIVNYVLANSHPVDLGPNVEAESIVNNGLTSRHTRLETADLIDVDHPLLHDSSRLARTIMEVYHRERKVKNLFRWSLSRKYD